MRLPRYWEGQPGTDLVATAKTVAASACCVELIHTRASGTGKYVAEAA